MEEFVRSLALAGLVVFWYMLALFVIALIRRDNSVADPAWGPGFLLATLAVLWYWEPAGLRPTLITVLVAVWALRLSLHVLLRNWGKGEDWRYARWRLVWGHWWVLRSFLQVFVLQGVLLLIVALPALWVNTYGGPRLGWLDAVGAGLWLAGFFFETVADYQLTRFMKDPANHGRIMQSGLWRYSRHPNYFGEVAQWWGLGLVALSVPGGWVALAGPLLITVLILKVSGIPLLERRLRSRPEFHEYAKRTSPFFPLPPKKEATPAPR
jgi:steroid 5-alpha reductase family enzyme